MLGFAANGQINGPPVVRVFIPLETVSGPWDPSQMKDLAETHLFVVVSSNFDWILIPIDHDLWIPTVFRIFTPLEAISGPRDLKKVKDLDETHLFGPSFIKFRLIFDTYWPRSVNCVSTSNEWRRFVTHLLTVLILWRSRLALNAFWIHFS